MNPPGQRGFFETQPVGPRRSLLIMISAPASVKRTIAAQRVLGCFPLAFPPTMPYSYRHTASCNRPSYCYKDWLPCGSYNQ
jgi:hypothetical protein